MVVRPECQSELSDASQGPTQEIVLYIAKKQVVSTGERLGLFGKGAERFF